MITYQFENKHQHFEEKKFEREIFLKEETESDLHICGKKFGFFSYSRLLSIKSLKTIECVDKNKRGISSTLDSV